MFVKLTLRGTNAPAYIFPTSVDAIVADTRLHAGKGTFVASGRANVLVNGQWVHVTESPDEVLATLEAATPKMQFGHVVFDDEPSTESGS